MNKRIAIEEGEKTFPAVPHHVIYEILSRLPLETLMRFKTVSKEWLYTIHDQSLANEFSIHRSQIHTAPTFLVSFYGSDNSENHYYSLDLGFGLASPFENLNQPEYAEAKVLDTVMGLTCFAAKGITYFWNLRTREITALPQAEPDFPINSRVEIFTSLGFDPVKRQYKILKTWTLIGGTSLLIKTCHKVLTLGTTDWRNIDNGLLEVPLGGPVYLNGTLHYLTIDLLCRKIMVAFHVGTEKFEMMQLPEGAAVLGYQIKLILYRDRLSVVDFEHLSNDGVMTLYVLEDYQERKWVVKEVMMPLGWKEGLGELENFHVSGISTGEILLTPKLTDGQFYVLQYDVEKMSMKKIEIHGFPNDLLIGPLIVDCPPVEYGESILSLKKLS